MQCSHSKQTQKEHTYDSSQEACGYLSNHGVQEQQEECSWINKVDYFDTGGLFKIVARCPEPSPSKLERWGKGGGGGGGGNIFGMYYTLQ